MLTRKQTDLVNAGDFDVRGRQVQVTVWSVGGDGEPAPDDAEGDSRLTQV